jgi:hypothetical protein
MEQPSQLPVARSSLLTPEQRAQLARLGCTDAEIAVCDHIGRGQRAPVGRTLYGRGHQAVKAATVRRDATTGQVTVTENRDNRPERPAGIKEAQRLHAAITTAAGQLVKALDALTPDLDERVREPLLESLALLSERVDEARRRLGAEAAQLAFTQEGQPETLDRGDHRACAFCGQPFIGVRSDARYCSSACRQRAYRQRTAPR